MRSFLIVVACLAALAGGVLLSEMGARHPFELAQAWSAGSSLFASASGSTGLNTAGWHGGEWTPPTEIPAQPNWTWHTADGKTYENVVISNISSNDVTITHSLGIAHIPLDSLPADVQSAIHYSPPPNSLADGPDSSTPMAAMLKGKLIDIRGLPVPAPGAALKYYAIYYAAGADAQCHAFTPTLVDWYRKFKPYHHNFELIFVSEDKSETEMYGFMNEMQMPWPAVKYPELPRASGTYRGPDIQQFANQGIPDLVLVDASGKVLADSFNGSTNAGPQSVVDYMNDKLGLN